MKNSLETHVKMILDAVAGLPPKPRQIIAIAGPPGAGKTTLAMALLSHLNAKGDMAAMAPMDGFHLDNDRLDQMGIRHRKGAPQSFDADGFVTAIKALADANRPHHWPGFDRAKDATVPDQITIAAHHRIVITEGNYLLLKEPPWSDLAPVFDLTVFTAPDLATLEARLIQRWRDHGLSDAAAKTRALSNDIPNARYVLDHMRGADITLT